MMKKQMHFLAVLLTVFLYAYPAGLEIQCSPRQVTAFQGEKVLLLFKIKNDLSVDIPSGHGYFISYHISEPGGNRIQFENRRYRIPRKIGKKSTTRFSLPVYFEYPSGGEYRVDFDIVKEGEFWGADRNWKSGQIFLRLKELVSPAFKDRYLKTFYSTRYRPVNEEQYLLRMIMKNSEILHNNRIIGFSAGSLYPQIWIRDTATFMNLAKHHYPRAILEDNIELFLNHQQPNGEIADWVDISGKIDKNTVSTDQESSLVLAASEIAVHNPRWLNRLINGRSVFQRLETALDWVWKYRRDPDWNLISSGFTADWGDVENSYPDQRATKLTRLSKKVFSTYTQSLYIRAMDRFIRICRHLKDNRKARKWKQRWETVLTQTKKNLYSREKGYYLIHLDPQSRGKTDFEKNILAVGGNAEAILAGLMNRDQIETFISVLDKRRKEYRLPNVSFCLIPPYPAGFFPHPALKTPWIYQNGGQWDWIGGRLVKALFLKNFRSRALQYLLEIIKKNLKNFNIFEWEDRKGNPLWAAKFYTGAAGVLSDAIMKGYLGYDQDFSGHRFAPVKDWDFLNIEENDGFSFLRTEKIMVHIRRLHNRTIYVITRPGSPPVKLCKRGIHVIDTGNDNP